MPKLYKQFVMKAKLPIFFILLLLFWTGCEDDKPPKSDIENELVTTFYFIRHAEKDRSDPEDIDPELNQRGLGRAMHWAEILKEVPLNAIYTTDFERTSMTAAPAAIKQDITVQYYDPDEVDIEQFLTDNLGNNVLVVGHSNSTPAFVNKIIGQEKYGQMDDYDNGSLFIVQRKGDSTTDTRLHFNCNCPD
jgi:broad specificity phosphatase PhoE